jgi:hypothetical protein
MVEDGDDIVSLPSPPPPRPASRREAIEVALRKFDGIEPTPTQRNPLRLQWAAMNRRPAGALVAATLIAVIAIPAIQIALRDGPPSEVAGTSESAPDQPAADELPRVAANESVDPGTAEAVADTESPPPAQARSAPLAAPDESLDFAFSDREEKARLAAPALETVAPAPPVMVATPPPPPPPAARRAAPQAQASDTSDNIVVTGALIRQPNLESAAPVTVIDPMSDFLSRLQGAFVANDRGAVMRLIGLPLRVSFDGNVRNYRVAPDVERDFDRIFTPQVRASVLQLGIAGLSSHEGGRLKGNARIRFGCGKQQCSSGETVRIREVNP